MRHYHQRELLGWGAMRGVGEALYSLDSLAVSLSWTYPTASTGLTVDSTAWLLGCAHASP